MRHGFVIAGVGLLAAIWVGPLPALSQHSFSAHMAMHIAVVALAAPLLAWGIAGARIDPVRSVPWLFAPIPASMFELVIVWGWHAPLLHEAARAQTAVFVAEQATFLAAGLLLWLAAVGGAPAVHQWRATAGVGALLFTSIHMTLLGALFALTPRPLYRHHGEPLAGLSALTDQHVGGAIMLLVGGASYLAGALWLLNRVLRSPVRAH